MPSTRKRIGYLPSINAQMTITKIANKEKLSHSKVVGILVEEALKAREVFDLKNSNHLNRYNLYNKENNIDNSALKYNDLDEFISDKGVAYNAKKYNYNSVGNLSEATENFDLELFEQFKQFILFQKMTKEK